MRNETHVFMMATKGALQSFSPNGEYFALSSADGTLRLWDTATGNLKQEYTPSSHLSATCSCLSWRQTRQTSDTPRKKKKRKSVGETSTAQADLLALGTTSGSILIYSVIKGDIKTQLIEGGHTGVVNGVCWHSENDILFSCSADQHIIQWNLSTGTAEKKWRADKGQVYSICLGPSEHHLISAGRSIKVWDLRTKQVVKTFSGHATEVVSLLPIPSLTTAGVNGEEGMGLPPAYFLSAAVNDRVIHAWHTGTSAKEKNALCSFSLPEEPLHMILGVNVNDQGVAIGVVTTDGQLLIFEHVLNGPQKKPLKPKITVQVVSEGKKDDTPKPISILGVHIQNSLLTLSHGNFIKPTFESLKYNDLEPNTCLIRKGPSESVIRTEVSVSKVKIPEVSENVTVLAPGHMAPSAPTLTCQSDTDGAAAKRKRKKSITGELSLNERLNAISADQPSASTSGLPRADNMATLLAQGLQSNDKKILNNVLQQTNESIIRNTVRRLPVPMVVPLVKELSSRMRGHAQSGKTFVKWMKTILTLHTSYLMTFPEVVNEFSGIYQMMDSRVLLFSNLSRLQGKLDLMLSQVTSQTEVEEGSGSTQPMLIYQDESSEEDVEEDLVADLSGVEEDWEGDSDMDAEEKDAAAEESDEDAEMESDDDED